MSIQFSLFGGEEVVQFYRDQDTEAFLKLEKEKREKEEREYRRLNPSLVDFMELEDILSEGKCFALHTCNRTP